MNEENIAAYQDAKQRADAARDRKLEKREKKRRRQLRRRSDVPVLFNDDSSEGEPLASARRKSTGGDSLFVKEQGPSLVGGSHAGHHPVVPKVPVQQSSSEGELDSDANISESSLQTKSKTQRKADRSVAGGQLGHSLLRPKQSRTTEALHNIPKASLVIQARGREDNALGKEVVGPQASVHGSKSQQLTASAVSEQPKTQRQALASSSGTKDRTVTVAKTAKRAIRTAPQKQASRAIKIIDQPREPQRKPWSTDNQYNKLKFRGLAEKRSRNEGTPDFTALEFVHGTPRTLPKTAASTSVGSLYGRRDITNRQAQEKDAEDRPRQGTAHDPAPLADYEVHKVPQMCASWRLSQNCEYGAVKCRFMHRDLDPNGKKYPLSDIEGWVPFKYRDPPLTCMFWYRGRKCKKSAAKCTYAHEDTGWTEHNGVPTRINRLAEAQTAPVVRDVPPSLIPPKLQDSPITCSFWLRDPHGCQKTEETCKYAHWNTGWAPPEHNIHGQPRRIDADLRPRAGPPNFARPPVTCPFWLRSEHGCTKSEEQCKYAHRNTGWAPPGLSSNQAVPINPLQQPRKKLHDNVPDVADSILSRLNVSDQGLGTAQLGTTRSFGSQYLEPKNASPPITCSFWLEGSRGCDKSDEACKFAHYNTGWMTLMKANSKPQQIDTGRTPRFQRYGKHQESNIVKKSYKEYPAQLTSPLEPLDFSNMLETRSARPSATEPSPQSGQSDDIIDAAVVRDVAQDSEQQLHQMPVAKQGLPQKQTPSTMTCSELDQKIAQIYDLDAVEMFHPLLPGDDTMLERRAMLLFHPEEHSEDIELITRWLLMHEVEVANFWYDGAWSHFREETCISPELTASGKKETSGIIIVCSPS